MSVYTSKVQFLHFKNKKFHFKSKYIKEKITDNEFKEWIEITNLKNKVGL